MKVLALASLATLVFSISSQSANAADSQFSWQTKYTPKATVKEKTVSVLFTTQAIGQGQDILPANLQIKQIPQGQVPPDAISTKDLVHVRNGKAAWQARYALAEGTLVSYHVLGPGSWHSAGGRWVYGGAAGKIAKASQKNKSL